MFLSSTESSLFLKHASYSCRDGNLQDVHVVTWLFLRFLQFFVDNMFFFLVGVADDSGEITWDGYRTTDQRSRAHLLKNPRRRDDFQLHLPRQSGKLKHDIFLNLTMFFFVPELHENTALKTFKENICRNVHCQHLNSFSRSKPRVILEKILWSSTRWADPGEDIE